MAKTFKEVFDALGIRMSAFTPEQQASLAASFRHTPRPNFLQPGVYTQTVTGRPSQIGSLMNQYHQHMFDKYWDYQVIDTTSVTMPDGVAVYITFSVGECKRPTYT